MADRGIRGVAVQSSVGEIGAQVRALVHERTRLSTDLTALPEEQRLADVGVDSIALLGVVVGVEERFDIEVPDRDVTPDNFASIGAIARYVAGRLEP